MSLLDNLKIKIYADGPQRSQIDTLLDKYPIQGLTFNPALLRKNGVISYAAFGREVAYAYPRLPMSFEVIADNFTEIAIQAERIASWGDNVYVKIPVMLTNGESTGPLIQKLAQNKIKINVTAICTGKQCRDMVYFLGGYGTPAVLSVFAGRILDTGHPAGSIFSCARKQADLYHGIEVLWASARRVYDIFEADNLGCDIITLPPELLQKLDLFGKDLEAVSRDTVQMFYEQAQAAKFVL